MLLLGTLLHYSAVALNTAVVGAMVPSYKCAVAFQIVLLMLKLVCIMLL